MIVILILEMVYMLDESRSTINCICTRFKILQFNNGKNKTKEINYKKAKDIKRKYMQH